MFEYEETCKTIRLLHRTLMVVSGLVIVFAFSPDPAQVYRNSKQELLFNLELDLDEFAEYAAKTKSSVQPFHSIGMTPINSNCMAPNHCEPLDCLRSNDIRYIQNIWIYPVPGANSNVLHSMSFFRVNYILSLNVKKSDMQYLISQDKNWCKLFRFPEDSIKSIKIILPEGLFRNIHDNIYVADYSELEKRGLDMSRLDLGQVEFSELFKGEGRTIITLQTEIEMDNEILETEGEFQVQENLIGMDMGRYELASRWLEEQFANDQRIDSTMGATSLILDEVTKMTPDDGVRYLNRRINILESDFKLYGYNIDWKIALWILPLLTITIIIFLIANIGILLTVLRDSSKRINSVLIPVIILQTGYINKALCIITIGLFPFAAHMTLVFMMSNRIQSQNIIAYALGGAMLLIGMYCVWRTSDITSIRDIVTDSNELNPQ